MAQSENPILRVARKPTWAAVLLEFVLTNLPQLLNDFQEGQEEQALEALARKYREHRKGQIKDRRPEIEANRAAVDARLAERDAKREDAESELREQARTEAKQDK